MQMMGGRGSAPGVAVRKDLVEAALAGRASCTTALSGMLEVGRTPNAKLVSCEAKPGE
jgi:hypothetical protein